MEHLRGVSWCALQIQSALHAKLLEHAWDAFQGRGQGNGAGTGCWQKGVEMAHDAVRKGEVPAEALGCAGRTGQLLNMLPH